MPATPGPESMPGQTGPKPPRRRIGVEGQRQAIVFAALKVLESKPYEQVSVEDILREANVSRQTFYRCFGNKTEVYHQVFRMGNEMFLAALNNLDRSGSDPLEVADRALTGAFMFMIHGGSILRALYRETIKPDSEFAPYRREVLDALIGEIGGWASEKAGVEVDPLLVRAVLLSVEHLMYELASGGSPPTPEDIERHRRVVRTLVEGCWLALARRA